ncbi:nucleotidyltransferase family protein [Candidatus Reidiella endopervernicosa]|nr:nucleotidyltransferase family protein [Candidatus Reidiella endopervernicosa]QKQ25860.1 nucleotidyltransferase family protein [Candidatus Reidiella endopervernicosa]
MSWAWPQGDHDQLLFCAVSPDRDVALEQFSRWLSRNNIDDLTFREHRLLAAIAERFGKSLAHHSEYPRLAGLQRMLWTKSRMAINESLPMLRRLVEVGIDVMLIKGAARIALNESDQKARVAHDIDILIRYEDFQRAIELLVENGWRYDSGETLLSLKSRLSAIRGINLFKGRLGDIDLHQAAFKLNEPLRDGTQGLWGRAEKANFFGLELFVPSVEDRMVLAISHGGVDGHSHSDWLVDCALAASDEAFNWQRFVEIVVEQQIVVPSRIALGYLQQRLGVVIPDFVIDALEKADRQSLSGRWTELVLAKPMTDVSLPGWVLLPLIKILRIRYERRGRRSESQVVKVLRGRVQRKGGVNPEGEPALRSCIETEHVEAAGAYLCKIEMTVSLPAVNRRLEFELNSETRHIARLRARTVSRAPGIAIISFEGELGLLSEDVVLWVESRPVSQSRTKTKGLQQEKYEALPFVLNSAQLTRI